MSIRRNFRQGGHGRIAPAATPADSGLPSTRDRGRPALAAAMLTAALAAAPAGKASAKEAERDYDIPAQSLNNALMAFAAGSDLELVFTADTVRGRSSPGLSGRMTPKQGLNRLLAGSGVDYRYVEGRTVTLERRPAEPVPERISQADSSDLALGTIDITGQRERSKRVTEEESLRKNYAVDRSYAATKTDTPVMETPVSIRAVPRSVMDDQQVITVEEAVRNVSGVLSSGNFYDGFILRGFNTDDNTYRNGLRQTAITGLETANLREIEVLKGPASILYGRIQPGGLVNLAPKRALEEPYFSVQQQFGSYDLFRTTIDATGPLLDDKSLLGRMNIAYRSNQSFRDFVEQENVFIAPSITWRPTDRFEFNADVEYQHYTFTYDSGIPAVGSRPARIPISRFLEDALYTDKNNPNVQDKTLLAFDWTYRFNDDWRVTNRFQYTNVWYHQTSTWFGELDEATGLLTRGLWDTALRRNTYATNLDLAGKFDTGILHHDVLAGFDLYHYDEQDGPGPAFEPYGGINSINIYHPVYTGIDLTRLPGPDDFSYTHHEYWYGIYFQDQITLWDKLHILGGGRQDWAENATANGTGTFENIPNTAIRNSAFNPRVGVLYQPWPWLSVYGNYSEGFGPPNRGIPFDGKPVPPETAQQGEVGLKTEFFDKRLLATLAFYDLTKQNIQTPDPLHPRYSLTIGEARSRGMELDVAGNLTENWSVIANYAYTDTKVTQGTPAQEGNRLINVPLNAGSVWTKYEFADGALMGLSFGTGILARGQRQGDVENTVQLPGFVRWDANVAYSFKQFGTKITTQLNVYNILDKTYYISGGPRLQQYPGVPLSFLGSVRVEF